MGDLSLSSARASSSSPALAVSSSPFSTGNTCSAEAGHSSVCNPETPLPAESFFLRKLSSNLYGLISTEIDDSFSDVLFYVSGSVIPLHRCILAARSPFFKTLFSKDSSYLRSFAPEKQATTEDTKLKIDFDRLLSTLKKVGGVSYGAFMATIGFLYSGQRVTTEVKCIDDHCLHEACRPVIDFAVEMLGLSSVLDVTDLKNYWEDFLQNVLEKAQVDDILPILVAAKTLGHEQLLLSSQNSVAVSNMSTIDIQKQLPMPLSEEVLLLRCKMGLLQPETLNPTHERQCQRIWKALDSHDIELVQLLLKEGKVTLDGANALHYAVAYCDTHLVNAVLQLGLSDLNARNNRGFTVLHVAAMRLDPSIVLRLLFSGANHLETTPDGRTALQLSSRLIRRLNNDSSIEIESLQKGRICVEILYQAGTNNLVDVPASPLPANDEELYERLLYLENRVALGRLLFPEEGKILLGITQLETTAEFVGVQGSDFIRESRRASSMDLNQAPSAQYNRNAAASPSLNEAFVKRVDALQRTVSLGKKLFPRCTRVLNSFMDDDLSDQGAFKVGSPEEHAGKKQRYSELKSVVAEAFQKDVAAMERHPADSCKG